MADSVNEYLRRTTFEFKGRTYVVRIRDGAAVYREEAHLGGPWSEASRSISNTSLHSTFRRLLAATVKELLTSK